MQLHFFNRPLLIIHAHVLTLLILACVGTFLFAASAAAAEEQEDAAAAAKQEQAKPEITQTKIKDRIHLLQGDGGNIVVINGDRSLLVIDNGYPEQAEDLAKAIAKVGNKPIRFLVNTHWHFDHAGGNEYLGHRTNIVAHENVRKRLAAGQNMKAFNRVIPPAEPQGLPVVTYTDSAILHEAGQRLNLKHFPSGHTDGDSVVFIEPAKIVHMGDHYFFGAFPFVDLGSGGSVQGVAKNIKAILPMLDDDWVIVPGHGPLASKKDLAATLGMLEQSIAWMQTQLDNGLTMKQAGELGMPEEFKPWGKGFINEASWIGMLYASLAPASAAP